MTDERPPEGGPESSADQAAPTPPAPPPAYTAPTYTPPPVPPPPAAQPAVSWAPPPASPQQRGFNWGDFLAFRYMVTPIIIRVIYVIGVALITIGSLAQATAGVNGLIFGVIVFLIGNLYWRVVTELFMVFFGMHESLRSIERQGRR